jgi:3-oxoacyl-[acyl-carrier protein] reductase
MVKNLPVMVVSGTSKGIGRGICQYFLSKGYLVAGCSRGPSTLDAKEYHHTQVDVSDEKQVIRWVRSVKKTFGHIDVLVCNAGFAPADLLMTMVSGKVLKSVLDTNIAGTFFVSREVAKMMMTQQSGRIITISSMAEGLHEEGTSAYSASKSAIVEMTKILAKELAVVGITCNVIAPSMFMSESVEVLGQATIERAKGKLAIKREVTMDEICNVVSFFIAPESGCITGQVIYMGLVK